MNSFLFPTVEKGKSTSTVLTLGQVLSIQDEKAVLSGFHHRHYRLPLQILLHVVEVV